METSEGPDLLSLLRKLDQDKIPEDIREECFDGIKDEERPQKGDWFAIWGGKFTAAILRSVLIKQRHRAPAQWQSSLPK